jgi:hypothetical protein
MVVMADEPDVTPEASQTAQEPPWAGMDPAWQWNPLLWQPRYEISFWWPPPGAFMWPWEPQ